MCDRTDGGHRRPGFGLYNDAELMCAIDRHAAYRKPDNWETAPQNGPMRMGSAPAGRVSYPIVNCDLSDVQGSPGLPAPDALAREVSRPRQRWHALGGPDTLFLATTSAGVGAFEPVVERIAQPVGTQKVQTTFRSAACSQETRQQLLRGRPVIGGRFRVVTSAQSAAVLGGPVGDLDQRDPGRVPTHRRAEVTAAVREHLAIDEDAAVGIERVMFPMEGRGVWAFRARVTHRSQPVDVRAYVRADDLSLLYAQDVSSAARFGEGRVFRTNPGRHFTPEIVRLGDFDGRRNVLATDRVKLVPAAGKAVTRPGRDFRLEPVDSGFEEVCAFHHMTTAMRFFEDVLGPDVFTDRPFLPLEVRVQDRTVRNQVGVFFPGRASISLADGQFPAARSGDICIHEFTHGVVHRIARLDDEFASKVAAGLNEGFADYAQATTLDDPRFGDWVRQEPNGARNCADPALRLPTNPDDRYEVGSAWAALLWDLRSSVGRGVADAIAFHSLHFLVPGCDYDDARQALHHADLVLFPARKVGRHRGEIDQVFDGRTA
jgi:hypothetical protein